MTAYTEDTPNSPPPIISTSNLVRNRFLPTIARISVRIVSCPCLMNMADRFETMYLELAYV